MALYFVTFSQSTGVWTLPLILVFQGQAKYSRDKPSAVVKCSFIMVSKSLVSAVAPIVYCV